jgi:hypothetical protein
MKRRTFLGAALACAAAPALSAALGGKRWDDAAEVLEQATADKLLATAVLHVVQRDESFTRHFGKAASGDAMFSAWSGDSRTSATILFLVGGRWECSGQEQADERFPRTTPVAQALSSRR